MSMIPQFGFGELFLLAAIALIVVGPKDLPRLLRGVGRFFGQARALAREFQSSFEQMAREADMEELRREVDDLRRNNPVRQAKDAVDEAMRPVSDDISRSLSQSDDKPEAGAAAEPPTPAREPGAADPKPAP